MSWFKNIFSNNKHSKAEVEHVQPVKEEISLQQRYVRTKGLRLYEYNPSNHEVHEIEAVPVSDMQLTSKEGELVAEATAKQKITTNSNMIYFEALNQKSAERRLQKWMYGRMKELCNLRVPDPTGLDFRNYRKRLTDIKPQYKSPQRLRRDAQEKK